MPRLQLHGLVPAGTTPAKAAPSHDMLVCDGLAALISTLPEDIDFDEQQPEDIADWAITHNAILTAYCADVAVLPMALGAVFSTKAAIQAELQKHTDDHLFALAELGNLREFTIQLNAVSPPDPSPINTARTGRDFLRDRRVQRDRRHHLNTAQQEFANSILAKLDSMAVKIDAAGAPKPDRRLDCAALVFKDQIPALRDIAQNQHQHALSLGLDLVIAGPWPPYSFDHGSTPSQRAQQ